MKNRTHGLNEKEMKLVQLAGTIGDLLIFLLGIRIYTVYFSEPSPALPCPENQRLVVMFSPTYQKIFRQSPEKSIIAFKSASKECFKQASNDFSALKVACTA